MRTRASWSEVLVRWRWWFRDYFTSYSSWSEDGFHQLRQKLKFLYRTLEFVQLPYSDCTFTGSLLLEPVARKRFLDCVLCPWDRTFWRCAPFSLALRTSVPPLRSSAACFFSEDEALTQLYAIYLHLDLSQKSALLYTVFFTSERRAITYPFATVE